MLRFLRALFFGPPTIIIANYYAFVSVGVMHIRGRAIEDKRIVSLPTDHWFRNLRNLTKRMLSREIKNVDIHVSFNSQTEIIQTNSEGFYEGTFELQHQNIDTIQLRIPEDQSSRISADLIKSIPTIHVESNVDYAIISDIDDTILVTGVVSRLKWRLLWSTLFLNPQRRKTFKNAANFYKDLVKGGNPIFYISNSPWNLFDYLRDYLSHQGFPKGFILLRDYNIFSAKAKELEKQNKYKEIIKAFQACPNLPFILIGDAGEVDTDIYIQIAERHPDRVKAIYIRAVDDDKRMSRIHDVISDFSAAPVLVFEHTVEMREHFEGI